MKYHSSMNDKNHSLHDRIPHYSRTSAAVNRILRSLIIRPENNISPEHSLTDKKYTHNLKLSSALQFLIFFRNVLFWFYYLLIFFVFTITYPEIPSYRNCIFFQPFHRVRNRRRLIFFIRLFYFHDTVLGSLNNDIHVWKHSIFITSRQCSNEYFLISCVLGLRMANISTIKEI